MQSCEQAWRRAESTEQGPSRTELDRRRPDQDKQVVGHQRIMSSRVSIAGPELPYPAMPVNLTDRTADVSRMVTETGGQP